MEESNAIQPTQPVPPQAPEVSVSKKNSSVLTTILTLLVFASLSFSGYLYLQNQQLKQMLVYYQKPIESLVPTDIPTPEVTDKWPSINKYQGKYFEFDYPAYMTLNEKAQGVELKETLYIKSDGFYEDRTNTQIMSVSVKELEIETDAQSFFESSYKNNQLLPEINKTIKEMSIGGQDGISFSIPGAAGYRDDHFIFVKDSVGFEISVVATGRATEFDEILSTFKFIN